MPDVVKIEAITDNDRAIAARYRFFTESAFSSLGLAKKAGVEATRLVADVARDLMFLARAGDCTAPVAPDGKKDLEPPREAKTKK